MDKVYKRINWRTTGCNGSMDSNKYLYSQIARAICEAAYEKPLTVEEISLKTGLPTMYIEDELPRLMYGNAIEQIGNKYATDFIVLRLCDKKSMETKFAPLVADIADHFAELFSQQEGAVAEMDFYGADFSMKRLGYIAMPAVLRSKVQTIKDGLNLPDGPYPPRLDGGYGWFVVYEVEKESESLDAAASGSNNAWADDNTDCIYYYWVGKYFNNDVYNNGGTRWLASKQIVTQAQNGVIPSGVLAEDDLVRLIKHNLVVKDGDVYKLNFAVFTPEQFEEFRGCFDKDNARLDKMLAELILDIHKSFKAFVPKRLDSQINQRVSGYVHNIIGYVAEELICRGVLERPADDRPLTNGVFGVLGGYMDI